MLRYRIMYAVALIAAAATFVYNNTLFSLLLLITVIAALVLIKLSVTDNAKKISISCDIASACVMGNKAKPLSITVNNKSKLPMGCIEVVLLCKNHMFDEVREERVQLYGSDKTQTYDISLNNEKCGRSSVEIKEIYCCDIFNITRSKLNFQWKKNYTVYPPMPEIQVHAQKLLNAEFGGYNYDKFLKGHDNSEVFGIREYAEGDSLSAAHWKLSAKADEIIIREWSRPNNFRIVFVFDLMLKDLSGKEVGIDVLSSIMGLSAAISQETMRQGIGHSALVLNHGLQLDISVHQLSDSTVLFDEMMSVVIPENSNSFADEFLSAGLHKRYSKLIYIGPEANARMLSVVAANIDMSAIAIKSEGETEYSHDEGYPMYKISAEKIKSESQFIEL